MAQRVDSGIALLFHDRDTKRWVSGQQHAPAALYPRERPDTHFTEGWVGPRAGLDGRKISSPPGSDPGPLSPLSVTIPTELPVSQCLGGIHFKFCLGELKEQHKIRVAGSYLRDVKMRFGLNKMAL